MNPFGIGGFSVPMNPFGRAAHTTGLGFASDNVENHQIVGPAHNFCLKILVRSRPKWPDWFRCFAMGELSRDYST